jgi:4a-hydroxytetrahydrobiopterin dehydratase
MSELASKQCVPCRGGVPPLKGAELERLLRELDNDWRGELRVPEGIDILGD